MSDEAQFHLNDIVNQQNYHYWVLENSRELHKRPPYNLKLMIWWAVAKAAVVGPCFSENKNGNNVIVHSDRYIEMIPSLCLNYYVNVCLFDACDFRTMGSMTYTTRVLMDVLHLLFDDNLISRFADISWPPWFIHVWLFVLEKFQGMSVCV